ncbi:MAG: hypothetical protein ACOC1K_02295 [Nanoarchaeota archaeon]
MENRRFFQYLAGERKGEIVEFDGIEEEDDMVFVSFKDGSRCNEELILPLNDRNWSNQLMGEISDPNNKWRFKEEWVGRQEEKWAENANGMKVCVQVAEPGRKKVTPIPPKPVYSKFGNITNHIESPQPTQQNRDKKSDVDTTDPVWIMMEKAKKFDTPVTMDLLISLPSKSLFNVAKESFEEGGSKVIEYIIYNMDDKKIKDALKKALLEAYDSEDDSIEEIIDPKDNEKEPINEEFKEVIDKKIEQKINTKEKDIEETEEVKDEKVYLPPGVSLYTPQTEEEAIVGEPQIANKNDLNQ